MNTYLLPVSDFEGPWIESVRANTVTEAESKFVKYFADSYEFIDYGDSFPVFKDTMIDHDIQIGDIYDIEEF